MPDAPRYDERPSRADLRDALRTVSLEHHSDRARDYAKQLVTVRMHLP
jgi:hypothetical protein